MTRQDASTLVITFAAVFILTANQCVAQAAGEDRASSGTGFVEAGGMVVIEAENFHASDVRSDPHNLRYVAETSKPGYSGKGYIATTPPYQGRVGAWKDVCETRYMILFETEGAYTVWLRGLSVNRGTDSCRVGLDGKQIGKDMNMWDAAMDRWVWTKHRTPVNVTRGSHVFNVRHFESGHRIDKMVLTTNPRYKPTGKGPAESRMVMAPETPLPEGVKVVWDLARAYREATPTRERICINGLWRWQPADREATRAPTGGWGFFKVPGCWPGFRDYMQKDCQRVLTHLRWSSQSLTGIRMAWHQRELRVPADWKGRRVAIRADTVNSHAAVYLNGKRMGEIRFPGGEVDLTSGCSFGTKHTLSMLVTAMPLKGVMLSFNDTASARKVKGTVRRRGLCGDVYLSSTPRGERIERVDIATSVQEWRISPTAVLRNLREGAEYRLRARILDKDQEVKAIETPPFTASDVKKGRLKFEAEWRPEKLWDLHTPGNTYALALHLLRNGETVDTFWQQRFGFREFRIDGRDFYLNGTRVFLSFVPMDNAQIGVAWAGYARARESMERLKSFGVNAVFTHNYGCTPGSHLGFQEVLRAADDVGILVSFSQPHTRHYDWEESDAAETNGYRDHASFYVEQAGNHPSVVMYSMNHNACGYGEDMNPDLLDGKYERREQWSANNAEKARYGERVVNELDPRRIVYHHSSGNLGTMHTSNFYLNMVPIQERSDWFEDWATDGIKPLFLCEYGEPISWNWTMYRGWYKGTRAFGSAKVPWEFCLAEWNAQYLGDRAYRISEMEKVNLRWEAEKFKKRERWHRWDYPYRVGSNPNRFMSRHAVWQMYVTDNWRHYRTWGLSAFCPWSYSVFWKLCEGVDRQMQKLETDWDKLQRPGFSADFIEERYERMDLAFERSDWQPTAAGRALIANNRPLLAYIGGKPGSFTEKGHNFSPGETVRKQLIVINNSREKVTCDTSWNSTIPGAGAKKGRVEVETGTAEKIPLVLDLPDGLAPGTYTITAQVEFGAGERQVDSFDIHVLPKTPALKLASKVGVLDPEGDTTKVLGELGISFTEVSARDDLSAYDLVVVGRRALKLKEPAPAIDAVSKGQKVVIFEQETDIMEKRFGFRVQQYGLRRVFRRVPDHPVLAGLREEHLSDWRGTATLLPPRLKYETFRHAPAVTRCGIKVSRAWRAGCRGNVASVILEKPAQGDFVPVLDGGFSLQYAPLMEFRHGRGAVMFCQLDVSGRTDVDPAARLLASNILAYLDSYRAAPRRQVIYAGEDEGREHLRRCGTTAGSLDGDGDNLKPDCVLVVGPGGGKELSGHKGRIANWLEHHRGYLLAVGLDADEVNQFLPLGVETEEKEHINAYFKPPSRQSPLAGVGPADVHSREPRQLPLVTGGEDIGESLGDGVIAESADGRIAFLQMAPWRYDYSNDKYNVKRTFRHASVAMSRVLGNMGVSFQSPIIERFSRPPEEFKENPDDILEALWLEKGNRECVLPLTWKGLPLGNDKQPPAGWQSKGFNDRDWLAIRVPGTWEDQFDHLADWDESFLYRVEFDVPGDMAGAGVTLVLGAIDDEDWTYVNGKQVGSITSETNPRDYWKALRKYPVPAGLLTEGKNVLAVKVRDLRQAGGIKGLSGSAHQQERLRRRRAGKDRYLSGLYLDTPIRWDDPYRFFRW